MIICSNCEEREAKVHCIQCDEPMCTGCSITHPSVKLYRGHKFKVIAEKHSVKKSVLKKGARGVRFDEAALARDAASTSGPLKLSYSEVSTEEVTESSGPDKLSLLESFTGIINSYIWADDWQSHLIVMLMTFVLYVLLKLLLGRLSVVILVVCAFAVIRNANKNKNSSAAQAKGSARSWWEELVLELRELFQAGEILVKGNTSDGQVAMKDISRLRQELYNTTAVPEYDEREFKDEFWHNAKPRRRKMQVQIKRAVGEPSILIR